jgi:hypothetical protein
MSTYKADKNLTVIKVDHGDQAVFIAFDVEDNPVVAENAYDWVMLFQLIR